MSSQATTRVIPALPDTLTTERPLVAAPSPYTPAAPRRVPTRLCTCTQTRRLQRALMWAALVFFVALDIILVPGVIILLAVILPKVVNGPL